MCPPTIAAAFTEQVLSRRRLIAASFGALGATMVPSSATAQTRPNRRITFNQVQDLTHLLGPNMPTYPGFPPFQIQPLAPREQLGGVFVNVITTVEHVGTHIDAPVHFDAQGLYVDQIPSATLIAPLVVVNIRERTARNPDTMVSPDDILAWERRHGRIPAQAAVLMYSGWDERIGSSQSFRNSDSSGVMHFPGFGLEAVRMLLHERNVVGIGVDTLSLDQGATTTAPAHLTWLPAGRWGLEVVANLGAIPPSGATLFVGAPKVASGSGGPTRLLAMW
jgi:kynurenine formamidase